jgi:hypothetical protein
MFLNDFAIFSFLAPKTNNVFFPSIQIFLTTSIRSFVFGSARSKSFNQRILLSFAFSVIIPVKANLLAFLFIAFSKFLSHLGQKATHQPFLIGEFLSPALAFQVHFCLNIFFQEPAIAHLHLTQAMLLRTLLDCKRIYS